MKAKIKVHIVNGDNEENDLEVIGEIIKEKNIISYYDENVLVRVIIGNNIIIERNHPDYMLKLIFDNEKKQRSSYKIFNPSMELDVEVETLEMKRKNYNFYIKYRLILNNENMGIFKLNFEVEE